MTAFLGAAGVVGLAIGFAARTSVSNILSGIFLLMENSFAIGDVLEYQNVSGVVQSINLFCVQLRTVSGKLIRIPNESILRNVLINTSYFHNRRIVIQITVTKYEYVASVQAQVLHVMHAHKDILVDPKPTVVIESINYFSVVSHVYGWADKRNIPRVCHELLNQLGKTFQDQSYIMSIHYIP